MTEKELLLTAILKCQRADLYSGRMSLTKEQEEKLAYCLSLRSQGIPLQYVLGESEFFGFRFKVDKRVLIPGRRRRFWWRQLSEGRPPQSVGGRPIEHYGGRRTKDVGRQIANHACLPARQESRITNHEYWISAPAPAVSRLPWLNLCLMPG